MGIITNGTRMGTGIEPCFARINPAAVEMTLWGFCQQVWNTRVKYSVSYPYTPPNQSRLSRWAAIPIETWMAICFCIAFCWFSAILSGKAENVEPIFGECLDVEEFEVDEVLKWRSCNSGDSGSYRGVEAGPESATRVWAFPLASLCQVRRSPTDLR